MDWKNIIQRLGGLCAMAHGMAIALTVRREFLAVHTIRLASIALAVLTVSAGAKAGRDAKNGKDKPPGAQSFDPALVNDPQQSLPVTAKVRGPAAIRAQVLLDRANFSPGEIDGAYGRNLRFAVLAFQRARGLPVNGVVDAQTWQALAADTAPVLIEYTINQEDVAGPFAPVPKDMIEQASLPALGFTSAGEELGERFHVSPKLLMLMNPGKAFDRAGTVIWVPNVMTAPPPKAASVVVDRSDSTVTALDTHGKVIAAYPATIGSEHDPLPVGKWKINGVQKNPTFQYNPELFWDADPSHSKARIAPGPNNPVGVVWIDLSKEHYGIHGTPEPASVGHTQSHGCIRLTNWDAWELSQMVAPGVPALLQE
jgi:lipoprotein-anchoring transpeptidase ErfK/SrfK